MFLKCELIRVQAVCILPMCWRTKRYVDTAVTGHTHSRKENAHILRRRASLLHCIKNATNRHACKRFYVHHFSEGVMNQIEENAQIRHQGHRPHICKSHLQNFCFMSIYSKATIQQGRKEKRRRIISTAPEGHIFPAFQSGWSAVRLHTQGAMVFWLVESQTGSGVVCQAIWPLD